MPWSIVGVIAGLAALIGGWLWWWWPKRQVDRLRLSDPKTRADVEDNFRKTIGQLLGGIAVLFGAWLAYLQFSQQQQASQRQFSQQQQASHDLLISNQVSKGFEQLGNDKILVRLGGIYALEGVMNTSEIYHQPVLEALSAFVRDGTATMTGAGPPTSDIQAVLTVIGRRARIGTEVLDLTNAHIPKADLHRADLSGANLSGATNLSGDNLSGANLVHADLSGADLSDANLSDVFSAHTATKGWGAVIRWGPVTNLTDAILFTANLSGASLVHANLSGADLSGANLSGPHTIVDEANLSHASLFKADLKGAHLNGADLSGARLSEADLSGASLNGVNFTGADLSGATVSQAQLNEACGTKAKLDTGLTLKPCQ